MPGIDIGAILATIGGMLLDSLMNALANTLTNLLTQAISDAIYGLADTLEKVFGANSWISQALDTFANNLVTELTQTIGTLTNAVNLWAHDTITILKNQQDLSNLIVGEVAEHVKALRDYLNIQIDLQGRTGAAFTDYLLTYVIQDEDDYEELGRTLFELQQQLVTGKVLSAEEAFNKGFNFVWQYLMADVAAIENMPREQLDLVSRYLGQQLRENIDAVREWFQQVVVVPISTANAFRSAFTEGLQMTPDEYAQQILEHQEAYDMAMAEYAKRIEKKLQKEGIIPK
ncbi:MAG: hypothetical protein DRO11_07645 [Methanobacteriota archaeon]|nr:MAG: hypothetical protein DRO11_07645 [Euryarchaeota archaeon]